MVNSKNILVQRFRGSVPAATGIAPSRPQLFIVQLTAATPGLAGPAQAKEAV